VSRRANLSRANFDAIQGCSVAGAVLTRYPASPAISGRYHRARLASGIAMISRSRDSRFGCSVPSVHSQELLYESLLNWQPRRAVPPGSRVCSSRNVLPDPEIAAERPGSPHAKSRRRPADTSSSQRGRASIRLRQSTARSNLPSPNFSAGRPRRWKACLNDW
jgi:hypothetical protein